MQRLIKFTTNFKLSEFGDLGDILKNTLFIRIANIFLLFLNGVVLARYLGATVLGVYVVSISLKRIISILFSFGFGSGVTYFSSQNHEQGISKKSFLKLSIVFSLLPCVAILPFFNFLELNIICFFIFSVGVFLFSFLDFCLKLARGVGKYKITNLVDFLNQLILLFFLVIIYFSYFELDSLTAVILSVSIAEFICVIIVYNNLSNVFSYKNGYEYKLKEIFSYSKWVYLSNSINIGMSEIPNLAFKFLGFSSIYPSFYSRAQSLINIPRGIFIPLSQNLFYHFSSGKISKAKVNNMLMFFFVFSFFCSLSMLILSDYLVVYIYGDEYKYAAKYIKLLVVGMTFLPVTLLLSTWFSSQGKPKVNTTVSILSLLIFGFSLFILYKFGAYDLSVIYALVIQQVSTAIIYFWNFYRSE